MLVRFGCAGTCILLFIAITVTKKFLGDRRKISDDFAKMDFVHANGRTFVNVFWAFLKIVEDFPIFQTSKKMRIFFLHLQLANKF